MTFHTRTWCLIALFVASEGCGTAPDAKNATCCQCVGDQHPCHWCPAPVGGCRYFGSAEYHCAGFIDIRTDCPQACASISSSNSVSTTASSSRMSTASQSPSPTASYEVRPTPSMRPFSKKGVGYYGGLCDDFSTGGLGNISWFYDW